MSLKKLCLLLTSLVVSIALCGCYPEGGRKIPLKDVKMALADKYGEEFTVRRTINNPSGTLEFDTNYFYARAVNYPDVLFEVDVAAQNDGSFTFSDDFINKVVNSDLQDIAVQLFSKDWSNSLVNTRVSSGMQRSTNVSSVRTAKGLVEKDDKCEYTVGILLPYSERFDKDEIKSLCYTLSEQTDCNNVSIWAYLVSEDDFIDKKSARLGEVSFLYTDNIVSHNYIVLVSCLMGGEFEYVEYSLCRGHDVDVSDFKALEKTWIEGTFPY